MFQWTGDLFIDVNHDKAERLGNAKLSCITNPRPAGLRFSVCFRAADSLRLQKLHPAADLYVLLRRCAPVQQLAKLEPQSDDDKDGLSTLSSYMQRGDLFTYAKATMDEAPIGHLFVFPDSSTEICKIFQVPQDSRNKGSLLCALVPFKLTPDECRRLNYRETHTPEAHVLNNIPMDKLSLAIQRTLHVLRFPEGLHNFLTTKRRTYYIWHTSDSPSPKAPGYETLMLMDILKRYEAAPATHKDYLSVIFVHAGALDAFRKFESLAERRRRECEVRFYIYGTHESVPPSRWGLREIYPIGGVVTFTPAAIIMDPIGVVELIQKVEEHPLWTCFILPSVVAMAAKMVCHGTSPLVLLDRGELILEELLRMIEEGSLSLLRSPPLKGQPKVKTDAAREWIARQMGLLGMDSREILEECIKGAARQYMDFGEDELAAAIDEEVLRQMRDMQLQPTIMDDYRRFVVITGAGAEKFRDGMELLPLSLFGFRDDYFLKETANGERPK
ncbi:hypothetical protein OBBRIDRAFT_717952 [Obba rivulosa]|uniref:Uncharacterized protein n=1 Tax=Obba rivulosa TaxID=1052685 RepID=A0A8E2J7I1_9APHY|nr:hypothetical protein OBBRIDRAFT_717952 [Obba rivulosa]